MGCIHSIDIFFFNFNLVYASVPLTVRFEHTNGNMTRTILCIVFDTELNEIHLEQDQPCVEPHGVLCKWGCIRGGIRDTGLFISSFTLVERPPVFFPRRTVD